MFSIFTDAINLRERYALRFTKNMGFNSGGVSTLLESLKLQRVCILLSVSEGIDKDRMESNFFETFKQMEICARQFLLVQAVHEVVNFSQSEIADNFDFPDLLRALSEYTSRQEKKESDVSNVSSNWGAINHFLEVAVQKLERHVVDETITPLRSLPSLNETKMFAEQFRRLLMVEFISIWVKTLEHERYRFSDLLTSLSKYAYQQTELFPENSSVWEVVATLLQTAAVEAQRQGDNLP